jgi:excisionase family DNA binding protein
MSERDSHDILLDVQVVAQILGVSYKTVYVWVEDGTHPHYKLGRAVRFSSEQITEFLNARRRGAEAVDAR